jgi:UDP-glucose 4-epimerase
VKALVTGAAGFLGSHLVAALLARGDEVVAFDHRLHGKCLNAAMLARVHAVEADIFDVAALLRAAEGCANIFHCAAIVGVDAYSTQPTRTMETEETGLRNVCRAALAHGKARVIYASSSAVYGDAGGGAPLREDVPVAPVSSYGIAKRFNELYLAAQFAEAGLSSVALRIFNVYGPRQDDRLVIPRFIRHALAGEPIVIYGTGQQTRDFVFIDDVVAAALACDGRAPGSEIVNVCSGRETAVLALAKTILDLTGSEAAVIAHEAPSGRTAFEVARCVGSRDKLADLIGSSPPTSLEVGLRRTIAAWTEASAAAARAGAPSGFAQ